MQSFTNTYQNDWKHEKEFTPRWNRDRSYRHDWGQKRTTKQGTHPTTTKNNYYNTIQNVLLRYCVEENTEVSVHLKTDGVKKGIVRGFDNWSILLTDSNSQMTLIYKTAIAALIPVGDVCWEDLQDDLEMDQVADRVDRYTDYYA